MLEVSADSILIFKFQGSNTRLFDLIGFHLSIEINLACVAGVRRGGRGG